MKKKYSHLSVQEKLALDSDGLYHASILEAIDRGISPPTRLSDALNLKDAKGWWVPADATKVYQLVAKNQNYGEGKGTGIAFLTEEAAKAALTGAFAIYEEGYGDKRRNVLANPFESFEVRISHIINTPMQGYWTKLSEYSEDTEPFDNVMEECRADLEMVRQNEYNRTVLQEQRKQYIDLAGGDEAIARAFWAKTKGTAFPESAL